MPSGGAGDSHTNSYCNGFTNGDANGNTHSNSHTYCYSRSDSNTNSYPYPDGNTHGHSNCHTNSHSDTENQPNAHSNGYSYPQYHAVQLCFLTRLLENPCGVAGNPITAWQRDLQSRGVTIDYGKSSARQWIGLRCAAGDCGKTKHRQRRGRKLYPTNVG